MAEELTPTDVENFTEGRLSATDPEVGRALKRALSRARRYCGWHVSPVLTETLTLDGFSSSYLVLPTLKVVSLNAITEDGAPVDLSEVKQSACEPGILTRAQRWRAGYSNITVDLAHGFTADEAEDWREAVLKIIDQAATTGNVDGTGSLIGKKVDDVEYRWSELITANGFNATALAQYRLLAI